jgi:hypothetical protein
LCIWQYCSECFCILGSITLRQLGLGYMNLVIWVGLWQYWLTVTILCWGLIQWFLLNLGNIIKNNIGITLKYSFIINQTIMVIKTQVTHYFTTSNIWEMSVAVKMPSEPETQDSSTTETTALNTAWFNNLFICYYCGMCHISWHC